MDEGPSGCMAVIGTMQSPAAAESWKLLLCGKHRHSTSRIHCMASRQEMDVLERLRNVYLFTVAIKN